MQHVRDLGLKAGRSQKSKVVKTDQWEGFSKSFDVGRFQLLQMSGIVCSALSTFRSYNENV